jgi:bifunctional non-homologous end joining protein LigD
MPHFIEPAVPATKKTSPIGPEWLHEVKFDGFRVQIHKRDDQVRMYSRNRNDLLHRFRDIRDHLMYLPDCIIDGELIACDTDGQPDFAALMRGGDCNLCIWCFDLLADASDSPDNGEQAACVFKRPVELRLTSTEAPHSVCGCGPPNRGHPMCRR